MAAMIVEIEKGVLTNRERKNQRWFPRWFTYNIREDEKYQWQSYVDQHPLKLGYGPDNNPTTTVAPRAQRTTKVDPHSQGSSPPTTPASQPPAAAAPTTRQSTTAVPASTNTPAHARQTSDVHPTTTTAVPSSVQQSSASPPPTANVAMPASPMATASQLAAIPKQATQPSSPATKIATSSTTSATPLPAPMPAFPLSAGPTDESKPSMSTVVSTSQGNSLLDGIVSQKSRGGSRNEQKASQKCQVCQSAGTKLCTGCRVVRYCSAEHQKQDWVAHKKECAAKAREESGE
jgi:hypothetical protein